MKYYIADLHLGHENIIKMSKRPFSSVEEMDKKLIENWNSVVTNNDDVYILGDVTYKSKTPTEEYLKQLKGKKHLIKGNHDEWLRNPSLKKNFESIDDYLKIQDGPDTVILFHYPIAEWDGFKRNIHLFGHIHNNKDNSDFSKTPSIMKNLKNAYNVGVDIIGFKPLTLREIILLNK